MILTCKLNTPVTAATPNPFPFHAECIWFSSHFSHNFITSIRLFYLFHRLERSKVRVTFFQSDKPQLISPPEPQHLEYFSTDPNSILINLSDDMASHTALQPNYNRHIRWVHIGAIRYEFKIKKRLVIKSTIDKAFDMIKI